MTTVDKVKNLCKERKIPISKLEKDLNFSNGYIRQLRKGTFPDDRLIKIANYFDMTVAELTGEKETDSKETPSNQDITFDDFTYALHNETKELSEEKKQQLLEMARFFKQQQDKKKEK